MVTSAPVTDPHRLSATHGKLKATVTDKQDIDVSAGPHKVKLVVVGTARHPRVDVDGFVVLR